MKEHEQQASRLEKISDFFRGRSFSKLNLYLIVMLTALQLFSAVNIYKDDFKAYKNFDPGINNWILRGPGGEVVNGEYVFSRMWPSIFGGRSCSSIGVVRDFAAGNSVAVDAEVRVTTGKMKQRLIGKMGIAVLTKIFKHGTSENASVPKLELCLSSLADGSNVVTFNYVPNSRINIEEQLIKKCDTWENNKNYHLEIILKNGTATGIVKNGNQIIYKKILKSTDFDSVFRQAFPAFLNDRITGAFSSFSADNLNSAQKIQDKAFKTFPLPKHWKTANGTKEIIFQTNKNFDFGKAFGGHALGKQVELNSSVTIAEDGVYVVECRGDWFWKLTVNGQPLIDLMKKGNGPNSHYLFIPLKTGENTLSLTVKSGSAGWMFCFSKPDDIKLKNYIASKNIFGSGKLFWNIDRIIDDINNLQRYGILLEGLGKELSELRKNLSTTIDSKDIGQYDSILGRGYAKVYDGYRYVELIDAISELKALDVDTTQLTKLETLAGELKTRLNSGKPIDDIAAQSQGIIDQCRKKLNGWAEGVTRGGSFGRFGWITSDRLGNYSSGDGLLTNQVLSSGAIARQYISSGDNSKENYLLRFSFGGEKDSAFQNRLVALQTIGKNETVELGYAPGEFYPGRTPENVTIKAINWIHKQFAIGDMCIVDENLLSPALLIESPHKEFILNESPTGKFTNVAYKNAEGKIVSKKLERDDAIYDFERNGKLGSNWIILWNGDNTEKDLTGHVGNIPLQIIFQHQPVKIVSTGNKLHFTFQKGGTIWLNTLYGVRLQVTGNWDGVLPYTTVAMADLWGRAALAYPTDCREFYRFDQNRNVVEILNKYYYRHFNDNDWNIKPLEVAFIPPVLSLMVDKEFDAELPADLKNFHYPTIYGPLYGVMSNQILYRLPIPFTPEVSIPQNTEAEKNNVDYLLKSTEVKVLEKKGASGSFVGKS